MLTQINKTKSPFTAVVKRQVVFSNYCETLLHVSAKVGNYPIPVAAQFKALAYCSSLAGIAGSNSTGDMDVCLL
jgi:hypothetical protein